MKLEEVQNIGQESAGSLQKTRCFYIYDELTVFVCAGIC